MTDFAVTTPVPPTAGPPRTAWIRLLRRFHFYAGVLVAPFLLIATISGGLYALAPAAEKVIYRAQLHTDSTGPAHSLAEQIAAARVQQPDLTVTAVRPAPGPGETTRVLFDDPSLPESTSLAVFVDPVTLALQGELPSYGSGAALPVRAWLSGLHRNLHLGEPGRLYSEFAASWLWAIALGGLILWLAKFRKQYRNQRRPLTGRAATANWHALTGVWIIVALLFLSATGLTWSRYAGENITELRSALSWTQPSVSTALDGAPAPAAEGHGHGHGGASAPASDDATAVAAANAGYADTALALARSAGVGTRDAVQVSIPADTDTGFTVTEVRAPWQFSPNTAVVDPAGDRVVAVSWFADWPLMAQWANLGIALHMGLLFGLLNQVVLFAVAVALAAMIVAGYRMWWQRRPRAAKRPGCAPARGALADLPRTAVVGLAVGAVAVGWFVPLLGWPLLAFLLIDLVVARQRPARASTSST